MTELQVRIETLQNMLIAIATGGNGEDDEFKKLRSELIGNNEIKKYLPDFLQTNPTKRWAYTQARR